MNAHLRDIIDATIRCAEFSIKPEDVDIKGIRFSKTSNVYSFKLLSLRIEEAQRRACNKCTVKGILHSGPHSRC